MQIDFDSKQQVMKELYFTVLAYFFILKLFQILKDLLIVFDIFLFQEIWLNFAGLEQQG